MRADIVITLDGQIRLITQEGSFEEGKVRLEGLLKALKVQGVEVQLEGPVEQHRHDDPGQVTSRVESR